MGANWPPITIHILLDDEQNVSTIEAIGTVRVKQPNGQTATSDKADYNKTENTSPVFRQCCDYGK